MEPASGDVDARALVLSHALALVGLRSADPSVPFVRRAQALVAAASDAEVEAVAAYIREAAVDWGYHPGCPLARALHRAMGDALLSADSGLEGAELLAPVRDKPLLLLPNHISYSDANLVEVLLARAGFEDLCQRLTVVAGPKVYSDPLRRFSSLCFGTIKVAQSMSRATDEAVMRPREVAQAAQAALRVAFDRYAAGDVLLLFPEGARSRDGGLQTVLAAVARYCDYPDLWLVPMGITGSDGMMGIEDRQIRATRVVARVGAPIAASELRARCDHKRPKIAAAIGAAIASALPPDRRGAYAVVADDPDQEPAGAAPGSSDSA